MAKVSLVTAEDNSTSLVKNDDSLMTDIISTAMSPLALVSGDDENYLNEKVVGGTLLAVGAGAFLAGERKGHKNAAAGKDPYFGGAV